MGFRYRKSIKLGKGVRLNINKGSVSMSVGGKGARVTVNSKGRKTTTVGLPGTGISYQTTSSTKSNKHKNVPMQTSAASTESSLTVMRAIGVTLIPLGALCFAFNWLIAVVLILAGIITIFRANAASSIANQHARRAQPVPFNFPETDENGHEMLRTTIVDLHGAMYIHDGIDPQCIIPQLVKHEQLVLEADPNNEHDSYAVKVYTVNHEQIGWLPAESRDISNRLQRGRTVYARVAEKCTIDYNNTFDAESWDPDKCWDSVKIEIARYSAK